MKQTDALKIIEFINGLNYKPNDWEQEFLDSINEKLNSGYDLTDKQGKCLEKIYEKASGGGTHQRRHYV